ncbi:uncharacterized protein LOC144076278 [Stigmatopora argus]
MRVSALTDRSEISLSKKEAPGRRTMSECTVGKNSSKGEWTDGKVSAADNLRLTRSLSKSDSDLLAPSLGEGDGGHGARSGSVSERKTTKERMPSFASEWDEVNRLGIGEGRVWLFGKGGPAEVAMATPADCRPGVRAS